jgi:hypothetical protein
MSYGIIYSSTFKSWKLSTIEADARGVGDAALFYYPLFTEWIKPNKNVSCDFVVFNVYERSLFPDNDLKQFTFKQFEIILVLLTHVVSLNKDFKEKVDGNILWLLVPLWVQLSVNKIHRYKCVQFCHVYLYTVHTFLILQQRWRFENSDFHRIQFNK